MRTIWTAIYMIGFICYSLPALWKIKRKNIASLPADEQDAIIFDLPKRWAKGILRAAGAKVTITGNEKFPEGPVLIVANHQGNFDIMALLGYLDKPVGFMSKIEVKKIPVVRSWMEEMHCVFIDRTNKRQTVQAFAKGIDVLKNGHSLVIFPEGTRTKGPEMHPFKAGSFRLAVRARVPVVPVVIDGTYHIMEQNGIGIKPAQVKLTVCDPIYPEDYGAYPLSHLAERAQTKIMQVLQRREG